MAVCRICGGTLGQRDAADSGALGVDSLSPTVVFQNLNTQYGTTGLTECVICPKCQTINQVGWLFCPLCGKRVDDSFLQVLEPADRVPTLHSSAASDPQTVRISLQTVASGMSSEEARPAAENQIAELPQEPADWSPKSKSPEPAPPTQPAAPEPAAQLSDHQTSASLNGSKGDTYKAPNISGRSIEDNPNACSECGSENKADYSFCLNCGASLPVTRTVVMASIAIPVKAQLRLLVQGNVPGPTYEIKNEATIGRTEGSITFPSDGFMSSSHARIVKRGADFMLIDEASSNGTFMKVKGEAKLEPGDVILIGAQLLRFEA